MRNSFAWKAQWTARRRYIPLCRTFCTLTHGSIKAHPPEVEGSLACSADKQVVDKPCMCPHTRTYTHTLGWWCELPRCVDLYQSPAIKLNWQTGTCTSPALQPVLVCSLNTCIRAHTAVLVQPNRKCSCLKLKWSNFLSCFPAQPCGL